MVLRQPNNCKYVTGYDITVPSLSFARPSELSLLLLLFLLINIVVVLVDVDDDAVLVFLVQIVSIAILSKTNNIPVKRNFYCIIS